MLQEKHSNLFTIIVPIYNQELFLDKCLKSLVNQTIKNFTVLLIDDGSTDGSKKIAKKYVKKYPKLFNYYYQKNKGLGGARNTGIRKTNTKYMIFLDSDDFLAFNTIEKITAILDYESPDIIITDPMIYDNTSQCYLEYYDKNILNKIFYSFKTTNVYESPELMRIEVSVWRCIWRTDFWKKCNLYFHDHIAWEDIEVHYYLFWKAETIRYYDASPTFFYRTNSGKQITSSSSLNRLDAPKVFETVFKQARDFNWPVEVKAMILSYTLNFTYWTIKMTADCYLKKLIKLFHKLYKNIPIKVFKKLREYEFYDRNYYLGLLLKSKLYPLLYDRLRTKRILRIYSKTFKKS